MNGVWNVAWEWDSAGDSGMGEWERAHMVSSIDKITESQKCDGDRVVPISSPALPR